MQTPPKSNLSSGIVQRGMCKHIRVNVAHVQHEACDVRCRSERRAPLWPCLSCTELQNSGSKLS